MTETIIWISIIIYLLSCLRMYLWNQNAYSKGGHFENADACTTDFLFTVIPFLNTTAAIYVTSVSIDGKKIKRNYNKFFNVNK